MWCTGTCQCIKRTIIWKLQKSRTHSNCYILQRTIWLYLTENNLKNLIFNVKSRTSLTCSLTCEVTSVSLAGLPLVGVSLWGEWMLSLMAPWFWSLSFGTESSSLTPPSHPPPGNTPSGETLACPEIVSTQRLVDVLIVPNAEKGQIIVNRSINM